MLGFLLPPIQKKRKHLMPPARPQGAAQWDSVPRWRKGSLNIRCRSVNTAAVLLLFVVAFLTACHSPGTGSGTAEKDGIHTPYSPRQIAEIVLADSFAGSAAIPPLLPLTMDDAYYPYYLNDIYMLETDLPQEGIVFYANGAYATEIAVFVFSKADDALSAKEALSRYKDQREDLFAGYAPDEAKILEQGRVVAYDVYTALLICPDASSAENTFLTCFRKDPPAWTADMMISPPSEEAAIPADTASTDASIGSTDSTTGPDATGLDAVGFDATGLDAINPDASGSDATGPDGTGSNATSPDATGSDTTGSGATSPDNMSPDASGSGASTETEQADSKNLSEKTASEPTGDSTLSGVSSEVQDGDSDDLTYDHEGILTAWFSGDSSILSDKDRQILEASAKVIAMQITDEMGVYEKELAIHDWMVDWADYDRQALSNAPDASPDPDNDNPYGFLLHQAAICSGYTSTFQLFMDMLEIECITVHGTSGEEEHAWNMVCIDGQWYCVDVTWDDPVTIMQTKEMRHRYFNVPNAFLKNNRHQWDESTTPEADARKLYLP